MRSADGKAERLFRAAISGFCALTRPTRRDALQLDDLTLPLYDSVSADTLRYVAAALSACRRSPLALVRRLAGEPIDISAPLLMRSDALADIDLVALIASHGLPHARAIGARPRLNPALSRLVDALVAAAPTAETRPPADEPVPHLEEEIAMSPSPEPLRSAPGVAAEEVRSRLRGMMAAGGGGPQVAPAQQADQAVIEAGRAVYERLRDTAWTGTPALFQTALADAAHISFSQAIPLVLPTRRRSLMLVLRGLGLAVEQAFLVVSAVDPAAHPHPEAVRLFHETFQMMHPEAGRDEIRRLRADSVSAMMQRQAATAVQPPRAGLLKAS